MSTGLKYLVHVSDLSINSLVYNVMLTHWVYSIYSSPHGKKTQKFSTLSMYTCFAYIRRHVFCLFVPLSIERMDPLRVPDPCVNGLRYHITLRHGIYTRSEDKNTCSEDSHFIREQNTQPSMEYYFPLYFWQPDWEVMPGEGSLGLGFFLSLKESLHIIPMTIVFFENN